MLSREERERLLSRLEENAVAYAGVKDPDVEPIREFFALANHFFDLLEQMVKKA